MLIGLRSVYQFQRLSAIEFCQFAKRYHVDAVLAAHDQVDLLVDGSFVLSAPCQDRVVKTNIQRFDAGFVAQSIV